MSPCPARAAFDSTLYFLSLPTVEIALSRVAERVRQGGHGVPEDVVRRRFVFGRENFETIYKPIVDKWLLYDNSAQDPVLLLRSEAMSSKVREAIPDPEAEGALAALRRARLDAERVALMTGTYLIQAKDGKPVRIPPRPEVARTPPVPGPDPKSS